MKLAHFRINELALELDKVIRPGQYNEARKIIGKWFKRNFEVYGKTHAISQYMVDRPDFEEYVKHLEHKMATEFALKLYEECGISKEEFKKDPNDPFMPRLSEPYGLPPGNGLEITVEMLAMRRLCKRQVEE